MFEKLKSRKLWLALTALLLVWFGVEAEGEMGVAVKLAVEGVITAAYLISQGIVDAAEKKAKGGSDAPMDADPVG